MKFVSRAQWGAQYAKGSGAIAGPVRGVTLHWEGPKMGAFSHDKCAGKVRTIERFHAVTRGWAGIAYNLLVCPHGYVFEGRGAGVRSAANGTSNIGGNDQWYAVCYLGGQGDGFSDAAKIAVVDAVRYLRETGGAGQAVNGHRDHHATECPGDAIYAWLQTAKFDPAPQPKPAKRVERTRGPLVDHALDDLTQRRRKAKDPAVRRTLRKAKLLLKSLESWPKKRS